MNPGARLAAVLVGLSTALLACGEGDPSGAGGGEGSAGGAGPDTVEVSHRFGTTDVPVDPQRVVTIDLQWTDVMLAMGVEPVGYAADPFVEGGTYPWQDLPADAEALDLSDGLPLEELVALRPDLIVGNYSIADEQMYESLSEIAPTVPDIDPDAQVGSWQELTATAGEILGRPGDAAAIVDDVESVVEEAAAEHPDLEGASYELAQYQVGGGLVIVADEADGSSVLFEELGMRMFEPVRRAGEDQGGGRLEVSTERADLLRGDLVAFLVNGGDESDLADIPGFDVLPGTVAVLDLPTIVGMNTPTPLSIPNAVEALDPFLAEVSSGG